MNNLVVGEIYYHDRMKVRVKLISLHNIFAVVEDEQGNKITTAQEHLKPIQWSPSDILEREG